MTPLPNIPTDSLYKFIALFGLVVLGFGLWYPDEKFVASSAKIRDTIKAQDLVRIRVNRKKVQVERLVKELTTKSTFLEERRKPLDEARAGLDSKREVLAQELDRILKNGQEGDAVRAKNRTDKLKAEMNLLGAKLREHTEEINKLNEQYKLVLAHQEEVVDELASEGVDVRSFTKELEDLNEQASQWLGLMISCIVVGWAMILTGFTLWYFRIQKYQDAILRKQAAE